MGDNSNGESRLFQGESPPPVGGEPSASSSWQEKLKGALMESDTTELVEKVRDALQKAREGGMSDSEIKDNAEVMKELKEVLGACFAIGEVDTGFQLAVLFPEEVRLALWQEEAIRTDIADGFAHEYRKLNSNLLIETAKANTDVANLLRDLSREKKQNAAKIREQITPLIKEEKREANTELEQRVLDSGLFRASTFLPEEGAGIKLPVSGSQHVECDKLRPLGGDVFDGVKRISGTLLSSLKHRDPISGEIPLSGDTDEFFYLSPVADFDSPTEGANFKTRLFSEYRPQDSDSSEKAYVLQYYANAQEERSYKSYDGRSGQYINLKIVLPESLARQVFEQVKKDPLLARRLAERVFLEKIGISQEAWSTSMNDKGIALRPPYEEWAKQRSGKPKMLFGDGDKQWEESFETISIEDAYVPEIEPAPTTPEPAQPAPATPKPEDVPKFFSAEEPTADPDSWLLDSEEETGDFSSYIPEEEGDPFSEPATPAAPTWQPEVHSRGDGDSLNSQGSEDPVDLNETFGGDENDGDDNDEAQPAPAAPRPAPAQEAKRLTPRQERTKNILHLKKLLQNPNFNEINAFAEKAGLTENDVWDQFARVVTEQEQANDGSPTYLSRRLRTVAAEQGHYFIPESKLPLRELRTPDDYNGHYLGSFTQTLEHFAAEALKPYRKVDLFQEITANQNWEKGENKEEEAEIINILLGENSGPKISFIEALSYFREEIFTEKQLFLKAVEKITDPEVKAMAYRNYEKVAGEEATFVYGLKSFFNERIEKIINLPEKRQEALMQVTNTLQTRLAEIQNGYRHANVLLTPEIDLDPSFVDELATPAQVRVQANRNMIEAVIAKRESDPNKRELAFEEALKRDKPEYTDEGIVYTEVILENLTLEEIASEMGLVEPTNKEIDEAARLQEAVDLLRAKFVQPLEVAKQRMASRGEPKSINTLSTALEVAMIGFVPGVVSKAVGFSATRLMHNLAVRFSGNERISRKDQEQELKLLASDLLAQIKQDQLNARYSQEAGTSTAVKEMFGKKTLSRDFAQPEGAIAASLEGLGNMQLRLRKSAVLALERMRLDDILLQEASVLNVHELPNKDEADSLKKPKIIPERSRLQKIFRIDDQFDPRQSLLESGLSSGTFMVLMGKALVNAEGIANNMFFGATTAWAGSEFGGFLARLKHKELRPLKIEELDKLKDITVQDVLMIDRPEILEQQKDEYKAPATKAAFLFRRACAQYDDLDWREKNPDQARKIRQTIKRIELGLIKRAERVANLIREKEAEAETPEQKAKREKIKELPAAKEARQKALIASLEKIDIDKAKRLDAHTDLLDLYVDTVVQYQDPAWREANSEILADVKKLLEKITEDFAEDVENLGGLRERRLLTSLRRRASKQKFFVRDRKYRLAGAAVAPFIAASIGLTYRAGKWTYETGKKVVEALN